MTFEYPCPSCGATNILHDSDCKYDFDGIVFIRKAYMDIISTLLVENAKRVNMSAPPGVSFSELQLQVDEMLEESRPDTEQSFVEKDIDRLLAGGDTADVDDVVEEEVENEPFRWAWSDLHVECLHSLKDHQRVAEDEEMGGLYLMQPDERSFDIIPTFDPIKTLYEYGPVDGAKDYAVYSMVSWCELSGLNWEQTHNFMHEWLTETDAWSDLSWGERSIRQLVQSKKHVHDRGLGWGDYAEIAAAHVRQDDRFDVKRISASMKSGTVEPRDYNNENYDRDN